MTKNWDAIVKAADPFIVSRIKTVDVWDMSTEQSEILLNNLRERFWANGCLNDEALRAYKHYCRLLSSIGISTELNEEKNRIELMTSPRFFLCQREFNRKQARA